MLVKFKDIPEWLHKSQLYRDFDEDSEEEIEVKYLKDNEETNNFTEFKKVLKVSSFWALDKIPYTVYVYAYYNKEEVENYLKIKTNNIYIDKYEEIKIDFYRGNLVGREIKMISFLEDNNFLEEDIQKIKLQSSWSKLRNTFEKILKSKSDSFYLNLLEEIDLNNKLVYNINEFVKFYKKHKNYNYAKEFLKEYKNTPKYTITTEFYENEEIIPDIQRELGNNMYRIIIKLFGIEIFLINDHFHSSYEKVNIKIDNKYYNFSIDFGIITKYSIDYYYDEEILIYPSSSLLGDVMLFSFCTIKLNIFNKKDVFDQIKNLKVYKTS
uniref:Uncharacterized protein n=1 Tax=viral metagenome TaxID=1070528 RepID=A0A6C0AFA2_9ZZZZ